MEGTIVNMKRSAARMPNTINSTTNSVSPKRARCIGHLTISVSCNAIHQDQMYRGRCKYKSGRCPNERTVKFNGEAHTLCEEHRIKHNKNQRKSDSKRRGSKGPRVKECGSTIKKEIPVTVDSPTSIQASQNNPSNMDFELDVFEMNEPMLWTNDDIEVLKQILDLPIESEGQ